MSGQSNSSIGNEAPRMQQRPLIKYLWRQCQEACQQWMQHAQQRSPLLCPIQWQAQQLPQLSMQSARSKSSPIAAEYALPNERTGPADAYAGNLELRIPRSRFIPPLYARSGPYHQALLGIKAPLQTPSAGAPAGSQLLPNNEADKDEPLDLTARGCFSGGVLARNQVLPNSGTRNKEPLDLSTRGCCTPSDDSPMMATTHHPAAGATASELAAISTTSAVASTSKRPASSDHSDSTVAKKGRVNVQHQGLEYKVLESALKGRIFNAVITNTLEILDPLEFLNACKDIVIKEMGCILSKHISGLKISCSLELSYLIQTPSKEEIIPVFFNSKTQLILQSSNLEEIYHSIAEYILESVSKFEGHSSSSKSLYAVHALGINGSLYDPLYAAGYIQLPAKIMNKKAVVNIKNDDDYCFAWCMLASKYPAKNNTVYPGSYPKDLLFRAFNYYNIEFPVALHQIHEFEKQNTGTSVAVFGLETQDLVVPLYQPTEKRDKHVNLLYIEQDGKAHYCLIKAISKLLRAQVTKHDHRMYVCEACMKRCVNEEALRTHKLKCTKCQVLKMPHSDDVIEFQAFSKGAPVPFVVYADIESVLAKVHSCKPSNNMSWTRAIQEHEAISISLKLVCRHDQSLSKFMLFRGPNAIDDFFAQLRLIGDEVIDIYSKNIPMRWTPEDKMNFDNASQCHICLKGFALHETKVRDHEHLTGDYLGAAHNSCNLNRKLPNFIPIFFHCLSNYDSHFLVRHLSYDDEPISCIAQSSERYLAFSKKYRSIYFRFLDSYRFLDDKLSSLAEMLAEEDFKETRREYDTESHFKLVISKGIFPYSYLDDVRKLNDEQLPAKEEFDDITEEEYRHALKVWDTFNIRNLGEYSDLYLKTDTLLLTDIFEKFRDLLLGMYKLDPAWFYTLPGIAFDAMLKTTRARLSLISDKDMLEFFESGIRGGLCTVVKRYSKANHMYMKDFDESLPVNFLSYWDINNLYGKSMASHMPHGNLRWLSTDEIASIDFMSIESDSKTGYVLEVDLEYPSHIHAAHNDLPFCPQSATPPNGRYKKLLATLDGKSKYVLHYRVLQQCIEQGLAVRHIHRVVSYDQSDWLKSYIDLNTEKRAKETSKFGQNLWKKMNNAVYGKFIENVRKYTDFRIVTKWEQARKLTARQTYVRSIIFADDLVGIELTREEVFMNKPIYIGHAILDISKLIMYDFFYNVMKPNLKNLTLNYMDTDSFIFETSSDIYKFIKDNPHHFDTSNFEKDNAYGIQQANKKVIGLFKDELGGMVMQEYVGLRSKLYTYRYEGQTIMKAKGIGRSGIRSLDFNKYFNCLRNISLNYFTTQTTFRSCKHKISTIECNKVALNGRDDKRKLIEGSYSTLAWGHYSLKQPDADH